MTTNKPSTLLIAGGIVLAVLIIALVWTISAYNGLVGLDENVNEKWANVQADYQRRADLIPNLVATVQRYTDYEGTVLTEITQARSGWTEARTPEQQQAAAANMDSTLSRLLVVMEAYPTLQANENYLSLQDELAGTENRIKLSRTEYNSAVKTFNQRVRSFPSNILAGMFGFTPRTAFEASAGSENAPDVNALFE